MFYYLLYNSSFAFIIDNRLFSTILYGSILYILTHAILNYCSIEILGIVNNYYWYIFSLDIISLTYAIYQSVTRYSQLQSNEQMQGNNTAGGDDNLEVTFNLLKNKINTIGNYFTKKNELTITEPIPTTPRAPLRINTSSSPSSLAPAPISTPITGITINNLDNQNDFTNKPNKKYTTTGSLSTPLSNLGHPTTLSNNASTPLSLLRENLMTVPDPIITENEFNEDYAESNAGSDLGSVMDLDDFEKSL